MTTLVGCSGALAEYGHIEPLLELVRPARNADGPRNALYGTG